MFFRTFFMIAFVAVAAFAQGPDNPFPNHEVPPRGWYCSPADTPEAVKTDPHACACLGMSHDPVCQTTATDPDTGDDVTVPASNDNAKCKVFCHKDSCTCMRLCTDS